MIHPNQTSNTPEEVENDSAPAAIKIEDTDSFVYGSKPGKKVRRKMATFWIDANETSIRILNAEETNSVVFYRIEVTVGEVKWRLLRRYSEFYNLHFALVTNHGVSRDILPSKRVLGNRAAYFVEMRRRGLEDYCHKIFNYLKLTMPRVFVEFFHFHFYDVFFLLQNLAFKSFLENEQYLTYNKTFCLSPVEAHAVSESLKRPMCPPIEEQDSRYDFSHCMDLFCQLRSLQINGNRDQYLQSNFQTNDLPYDLTVFKAISNIIMLSVDLDYITSLGSMRDTVEILTVNSTAMTAPEQILQCDMVHRNVFDSRRIWRNLKCMDLSNNALTELDPSLKMAPFLETLILDCNKITELTNLSELHNLKVLSLRNNAIVNIKHLHVKIGNVKTLNLAQNKIFFLKGLTKMYSIENLDLGCNQITAIDEIGYLSDLPLLESVVFTGNPVSTMVDYRTKVLEYFKERVQYLCLDNERTTQSEVDRVQVLRALRMVRNGKVPNLATPRQ